MTKETQTQYTAVSSKMKKASIHLIDMYTLSIMIRFNILLNIFCACFFFFLLPVSVYTGGTITLHVCLTDV